MIERWHDPTRDWASARGLEFLPDGLLPAWTGALARGTGAGSHRAGLVIARSDHSMMSVGGFKKYPERSSHHLCRGTLPGGLQGVVAHQLHLELDSDADGESWKAFPTTVVVARLPDGARVVQELTGSAVPGGTYDWRAEPAEDPALMAELLGGADLAAALTAVPPHTEVEYRYGGLCVSLRNAVTDAATLDALCFLASAFAAGMRRAAALLPELDPAVPLPLPPADTPRARWIDAGVARVQWHTPPASVPEAAAAYAKAVADEAAGSGRRVGRVAMLAAVVVALLALGITLGVALTFDGDVIGVALFVLVVGPFFLYRLVRGVIRTRREATADHVAARATPWGIEAFARGYAAARGMQLEDRDAFRRRFDSPVPGTPLKVLRDEHCRLVLWCDSSDMTAKRYHLIGVGARTVAHAVDDAGRSAENLDRLAAEVRLSSSEPALSSG